MKYTKVVVQNDVIKTDVQEIPETCEWMKKVLEDRQHSGRTSYNVLESEKQQKHEGDDSNEPRASME